MPAEARAMIGIRARAIRRCGELLRQIERAQGARRDLGTPAAQGSRTAAARDAGLSERRPIFGLDM